MQVAMFAAELAPAATTGGLGDVMGALPVALARLGHEVHVFVPLHRGLRAAWGVAAAAEVPEVEVRLHDGTESARIRSGPTMPGGPLVWAVEADRYFDRTGIYGEAGGDYGDNDRRFAFFARAALGALERLGLEPDVLHLHDWHAALIAAWLRHGMVGEDDAARAARRLAGQPVVLTVHNVAHQGTFAMSALAVTGLPRSLATPEGVEFHGRMSFLKAGLIAADRIVLPSPNHAREVRQPGGGFGLEGLFEARAGRLEGILNGIDDERFDPGHDAALVAAFDRDDLQGRRRCKADLLLELEIDGDLMTPVAGVVARLGPQKGFDIVFEALGELMERGVRLAVLGAGDARIARDLRAAVARFPGRVTFRETWDEALARRIYAGSDLFLMPSRWEPCGLSQMIALRYGAVPVVGATGGLVDSVFDARRAPAQGTGFWIEEHKPAALVAAIDAALAVRADPERWRALIRRGMSRDFSWRHAAMRHVHLYAAALAARSARSGGPSLDLGVEGWQEEIGDGLERRTARARARGFADWIGRRGGGAAAPAAGVLVAGDGRVLGRELAWDVTGGLVMADVPVIDGGIATAAALSLAIRHEARAGGICVTGVAHGSERSGLRFLDAWGGPILPDARQALATDAARRLREPGGSDVLAPDEVRQAGLLRTTEIEAWHTAALAGAIDTAALAPAARRGLVVALDHAHGPGGRAVARLLAEAGVPMVALREEPEPLLGGMRGAWRGDATLHLEAALRAERATLGIGISPDGGFCVLVDAAGRALAPSRASAIVLDHVLGRTGEHALRPGAVARTVATTRLVDTLARRHGRRVVEAPRGFAELGHLLHSGEAAVAIDELGGLSLAGLATDRDGALAALLAVEATAISGRDLGALDAALGERHGSRFLKRRSATLSPLALARLTALTEAPPSRLGSWRVEAVITLDGLEFLLEGDRWLLLCATAPLGPGPLMLWAEAPDEREAWALLDAAEQILRRPRPGAVRAA